MTVPEVDMTIVLTCTLFFGGLLFTIIGIRNSWSHRSVDLEQQKALELENTKMKKQLEEVMVETENLGRELGNKAEELKRKDTEIGGLQGQLQEKESALTNARKHIEQRMAESERLTNERGDSAEKLKSRDAEIKELKRQLEEKESILTSAAKELEQIRAESERLRPMLNYKVEEVKDKEGEIERLHKQLEQITGRHDELEDRLAELKKLESDILRFKEAIDLQKDSFYQTKQRIEESRMKMQLLNEKTKENVELIAAFAESKEFDDFRKSIHLDEMVQGYEGEIKKLKIENMDIKKRLELESPKEPKE